MPAFLEQGFPIPKADGMIGLRNGFACAVAILNLAAAAAAPGPQGELIYKGMADASAAVPVGDGLFVVADDETNSLRVYRRDRGGFPIQSVNLDNFLGTDLAGKKPDEADIEAAAQIGKTVYWIASHGRNKAGKRRPAREVIFGTEISLAGEKVSIRSVGQPYHTLLDDLVQSPALAKYKLRAASERAPKAKGGLNIEGLAATPDGKLLIGFRNPLKNSQALLVPILNPAELLSGDHAKLGKPIELILGGLGIRDIVYWPTAKQYVILAGPFGPGKGRIYTWSGTASQPPELITGIELAGWNPEACLIYPSETSRVQILSDDGGAKDATTEDPTRATFRGGWVKIR